MEATAGGGSLQDTVTSFFGSIAFACGVTESFHYHYCLGEVLGHGAHGVVYACVNRETGKECAAKLIARRSKDVFKHELDVLRSCKDHHGIIKLLDEFSGHYYNYIVLEQYSGHLYAALRARPNKRSQSQPGVKEAPLRRVVVQGLSALRHLQKLSVVHRDIKAENFLVDRADINDPKFRVVLSDFGLSQRLRRGYFLKARVGTQAYWAPEVFDGRYGREVDIFAFGVLAFLLAQGNLPFANETGVRSEDVFSAEGPWKWEHLTGPAQDFLQQSLQKDPQIRPSATALAEHGWLASEGRGSQDCSAGPARQDHALPTLLNARADVAAASGRCRKAASGGSPLLSGDAICKLEPVTAKDKGGEPSSGDDDDVVTPSTAAGTPNSPEEGTEGGSRVSLFVDSVVSVASSSSSRKRGVYDAEFAPFTGEAAPAGPAQSWTSRPQQPDDCMGL